MPQFFYKAKTGLNNVSSGFIQAESVADVVAKLMQSGHMPIEVKPANEHVAGIAHKNLDLSAAGKISPLALVQFTRQLADMLEAGVPLLRSLQLLARQTRFPIMNTIVLSMILSLQRGGSFSMALAQHPSVFKPLYVNTVKAAEVSGQLPLVLDRLAHFLDQDMQMRAKVKSSLMYPSIIFIVGIVTIFVLMTFVLPRLTIMFDDFDAQLPFLTQVVIGLSNVFAKAWWIFLGAGAGISFGIWRFLRTNQGRAWRDKMCSCVPLLKTFIEDTQVSRFARTLGMLLESGVPVVAALESVADVLDNAVMRAEVKEMTTKVRGGASLTQAIKASSSFPELAFDLIAVGEESGRLEKGLYKLAEGCERASQETAQIFLTILGPAVLIVVVGIVGFLIVAILLPMLQMNLIVK